MTKIGAMSGNTRFCPREGISVDYSMCLCCDFFRNWSGDPDRVAKCWWDWELEKELIATDEKLDL